MMVRTVKGKSMRETTTILGAIAALILGSAAYAQDTQPQVPAAEQAQPPAAGGAASPAPAQTSTIKSISIVDITELPADTQKQVNDVVAKSGDTNLKSLRDSIDASPQAVSALKAKGLTSGQVILASMDPDGTLTLITKKSG
jgi:hypothetical protein